ETVGRMPNEIRGQVAETDDVTVLPLADGAESGSQPWTIAHRVLPSGVGVHLAQVLALGNHPGGKVLAERSQGHFQPDDAKQGGDGGGEATEHGGTSPTRQ